MIALREDCLLVEGDDGNYLPCSADQLTLEFVGSAAEVVAPDILQNAAAGVLHYFKHELGRAYVTAEEFAGALAKALDGLGITADISYVGEGAPIRVTDLRSLAAGSGKLGELEFFFRLRAALREQLAERPKRIEFCGLRSCVKQLAARSHWCPKCDQLADWILELLRGWYAQEPAARETALVVR